MGTGQQNWHGTPQKVREGREQIARPLDNQGSCKKGPSNRAVAGYKNIFSGGRKDMINLSLL